VIAPDAAAYNANPLFAHATFTKAAMERLQEAHRTGDTVTFGPDEVSELKSELFKIAGLPSNARSIASLTVSSSPDLLAKRLPLRIAFVSAEAREEFSFIEFRFTKVGTEQFQIESCRPELPFRLTITLPWGKGRGTLSVAFSYEGHEIRRVCKAHRALRILFTDGHVDLLDLESDRHLGVLRDFGTSEWRCAPWFDEFLEAVNEIADSLHQTITYTRPTAEDVENVKNIQQIVRTGMLSLVAESVGLNLTPEQLRVAQNAFQCGNGLHFSVTQSPDFAALFGRRLNLGLHEVFISPSALTPDNTSPEAEIIPVQVALAKPILYRFHDFLPNGEENGSRGGTDT